MRKARAGIFTLSSSSLIVCECLMNIVLIFLDTFLVSKLLKLTPGDYSGVAFFNSIYYAVICLTIVFTTPLLKKINKSFFVSAGAVVLTGVFILVYLFSDSLNTLVWLFGILSGLGYGLFLTGFNNLIGEVISSKHQTIYFSAKNILIFLTKTIFPFALGSIIDVGSFPLICIVIALICVMMFVFSFLVKTKPSVPKSYNLFKFWKKVKNGGEDTKPLKLLYLSAVFRGLCFDIIATLLTVMLFLQSNGSDFTIGLIQTIFTSTQLVAMFLFMKFYHKRRSKWFLFTSLGFILAASIPVFISQNIYSVLAFNLIYTFLRIFITTVTDMRRTPIIRQLSMHANTWEHNSTYDLIYGICRAASYLLFLLCMVMPEFAMIDIILALNLLSYVGYTVSLYLLEKSLIRQDEKWKKEHAEVSAQSATHEPEPQKIKI